MQERVALIACSKNKKFYECAAAEMYSESTLFKKTLHFCEKSGYSHIFILSAKYGLLSTSKNIQPYDLTLNSMSRSEINAWADKVASQIDELNLFQSYFDFYTGIKYYECLSRTLPFTSNVMKGLGIGQRLKFLSN